jgi:phosphate transport system substrate-binding protein
MRLNKILMVLGVLITTHVSSHAQTNLVTGAGATFPAPIYHRWAADSQRDLGFTVNYQSIGSGGGQNQIINRTVDFGASDAPVSADRLAANNLIQIPMIAGAVVMAFNLPGVTNLRLTPDLIAAMYSGGIVRWNDARIQAVNPGVRLPNLPLAAVYRGDGSGTTWIFTTYLSRVSDAWRQRTGAGTSVQWPAGIGARGNEGVANQVQRTPGAIGYMEISFAHVNRIPMAQVQNAAGNWITPNAESSAAALSSADWFANPTMEVDVINTPHAQSWPIMGVSYLLVPNNPTNRVNAERVQQWVSWAMRSGDASAQRLLYTVLPDAVKQRIQQVLAEQVRLP